ncbi:MAG: sigma-70 family RNA polymerase sigma factor [Gemmatimonadota bacterium]
MDATRRRTTVTAPATPGADYDRSLLERMARGDEAGLSALYDRYGSALYAVAYRITGEQADAEATVLEAFSQAWREAVRFRSERGSVAAWLTMMCRSRSLDLVRARGRRARLVENAQAAEPEAAPGMGGWEAEQPMTVDEEERRRHVATALTELSGPQRQAIELAFYEGLSQSEIAERLGEPLGTIKTRVRLGMQKLRDTLRPYYFATRL